MNLNDTPSAGPLTATDLAAYQPRSCPPCDSQCSQGRRCPARMPAEACTDIGAEPRRGQHRTSWLFRAWLRAVRALT